MGRLVTLFNVVPYVNSRGDVAIASEIAGTTGTYTNKSLSDASTYIYDDATPSKKLQFDCSIISASTTRTVTIPDASGTMALYASTGGTGAGSGASSLVWTYAVSKAGDLVNGRIYTGATGTTTASVITCTNLIPAGYRPPAPFANTAHRFVGHGLVGATGASHISTTIDENGTCVISRSVASGPVLSAGQNFVNAQAFGRAYIPFSYSIV